MTTKKQNSSAAATVSDADKAKVKEQLETMAGANSDAVSDAENNQGNDSGEFTPTEFTNDLKPINEAIRSTLHIDNEKRKATFTIAGETFEVAESALRSAAIEGLIRFLSADTAGKLKENPNRVIREMFGIWREGYAKMAEKNKAEKQIRELLAVKPGAKKLPFGRTEILGELRDNLPPLTEETKGIHAAYASLEKLDDDKFTLVVESGKVPALVKVIESLTVKAAERAKAEAAKVESLASEFAGLDF